MKIRKNLPRFILAMTVSAALLTGCGAANNPTDPSTNDLPTEAVTDTNSTEAPEGDVQNSLEGFTFNYSDGIDENGFLAGIKALDYIEMFDYKGFVIPNDIHNISNESIQAEIDAIMEGYPGEKLTDRPVENGDTINIDFVGSIDGVEFDGGSTGGAGSDVTIGVTSYIDDFLEQLIGHMPGETVNVEVTFPDDYHETSLQGKDALFVTVINYIIGNTLPELTDSFVYDNFYEYYGWDTVGNMKAEIASELQAAAIQQYISDYLNNNITISSVPDAITEYQKNAMIQYYLENAEYYGMGFDEFVSTYVGVANVDELIEMNSEIVTQIAAYTVTLQAIAEDAGITVSEEDMQNYFGDYSAYVEQYGLPYLKQIALSQKVINYISDNAVME